MNKLQAAILGLFLAIGPSQVAAVPIDTSDFDSQTRLVETTGSVVFDGFADIFFASDVGSTVSVDSFLVSDPTNASLDFVDLPSILSPATAVSIMEEIVEFLFEDGDVGYLLVVDVTGQGVDFTDATSFVDSDALITLDELTRAAPLSVPPTLPLLMAGVAGLALVRRARLS